MKLKGLLVLALALGIAPRVLAKDTKKSITLYDAVVVGNVTLQPGDYKLEWQGDGPSVQVSFRHDNKTVATAPATLQAKDTSFDGALTLTRRPSGSQVLSEIDWKKMTLVFDQSAPSTGGQ